MNILITGCNGQLGTELQRVLCLKRTELGNIPTEFQNAAVVATDIDKQDISNLNATCDYVTKVKPDVIINCAAFTNVDACETDKALALKINAIGPRNLAVAAEKNNAKLVHVSTDYAFSGEAERPYCEWDCPNPKTAYGKSKLLGEQYVMQVCQKAFIVRTSWLYGYAGNNFVKTIIKLAKEKRQIKVVDDQRGTPTNAADLAHHILKIAASEYYGIYHCTGNSECSWFDFASEIVRLSDICCEVLPCTTEEFPRPARRPAYSSLDNLMLRCTVGDEMRNWKDALASFITQYM